jgi:hypothetical protein
MFSAAGCFANSGTAKVLATEALVGPRRHRLGGGEQMLESLVAYRLIDLGSEWHLLRHRYEHSAWEIYLAKDDALDIAV